MTFGLDPHTGCLRDEAGFPEGALVGRGCFETLYWNGAGLEGAAAHMRLLAGSAQLLGLGGGFDGPALGRGLVSITRSRAPSGTPARVRLTLLARSAALGGRPDRECQCIALVSIRPCADRRCQAPLSALTSDLRRNETSPLCVIKSINYGDNLLARWRARAAGADEALVLNTGGRAAGFAMANLIAVFDGPTLCTPPPSEGARPGFMRAEMLKAARRQGWPVHERPLSARELKEARAVFASNSLWGPRGVARLDDAALRIDAEIAAALCADFSADRGAGA